MLADDEQIRRHLLCCFEEAGGRAAVGDQIEVRVFVEAVLGGQPVQALRGLLARQGAALFEHAIDAGEAQLASKGSSKAWNRVSWASGARVRAWRIALAVPAEKSNSRPAPGGRGGPLLRTTSTGTAPQQALGGGAEEDLADEAAAVRAEHQQAGIQRVGDVAVISLTTLP